MSGWVEIENEHGRVFRRADVEGNKRLQRFEKYDDVGRVFEFKTWHDEHHLHGVNHAHEQVEEPTDWVRQHCLDNYHTQTRNFHFLAYDLDLL